MLFPLMYLFSGEKFPAFKNFHDFFFSSRNKESLSPAQFNAIRFLLSLEVETLTSLSLIRILGLIFLFFNYFQAGDKTSGFL